MILKTKKVNLYTGKYVSSAITNKLSSVMPVLQCGNVIAIAAATTSASFAATVIAIAS